jgi:hypothetical protein
MQEPICEPRHYHQFSWNGELMKHRAVLAVLLAVSLFACASYDHLPEHVRVVEFIVPGCD